MTDIYAAPLRVLVTGGAGFIGSHLTDALLGAGHQVVVMDNLRNGSLANLASASKHPGFTFLEGDITLPEQCLEATRCIDVVYHLACLGVRHSIHSPFENHRVNAEGSLNMLEACRRNGTRRFLYVSTSEVYGITTSFPITEESLVSPATVYGASKLAGERYAIAYHRCYGLDTAVFRIFNNYGPRAHYEGDAGEIIPRTIVGILYDQAPVIFGDGSITRDFFYVKDTARALLALMNRSGLSGTTLNVGTGREHSMKTIVSSLLRILGKTELGIRYLEDRPGDVPRLWVDAHQFYELTKFQPEYELERGLTETVEYYRQLSRERDLLPGMKLRNWE